MEKLFIHLLPPAMKLGQGYVFTRVCDSVHRGGVCPIAYWDNPPPPGPEAGTPLGADTPSTVHAGRYGQQAAGTHPTGIPLNKLQRENINNDHFNP